MVHRIIVGPADCDACSNRVFRDRTNVCLRFGATHGESGLAIKQQRAQLKERNTIARESGAGPSRGSIGYFRDHQPTVRSKYEFVIGDCALPGLPPAPAQLAHWLT